MDERIFRQEDRPVKQIPAAFLGKKPLQTVEEIADCSRWIQINCDCGKLIHLRNMAVWIMLQCNCFHDATKRGELKRLYLQEFC